jgi:predicted nucleic acid-binding protein
MNIYVDTSAFLAVLNADDRYHVVAKSTWEKLLLDGAQLYLNNYVLVETFALLQSRSAGCQPSLVKPGGLHEF